MAALIICMISRSLLYPICDSSSTSGAASLKFVFLFCGYPLSSTTSILGFEEELFITNDSMTNVSFYCKKLIKWGAPNPLHNLQREMERYRIDSLSFFIPRIFSKSILISICWSKLHLFNSKNSIRPVVGVAWISFWYLSRKFWLQDMYSLFVP